MQEETPLAPAQIITSVILDPQCFLHSAVDTMGRAACCSLSGVLRAAGIVGMESGSLGPPAYWTDSTMDLFKHHGDSCCLVPPQAGLDLEHGCHIVLALPRPSPILWPWQVGE